MKAKFGLYSTKHCLNCSNQILYKILHNTILLLYSYHHHVLTCVSPLFNPSLPNPILLHNYPHLLHPFIYWNTLANGVFRLVVVMMPTFCESELFISSHVRVESYHNNNPAGASVCINFISCPILVLAMFLHNPVQSCQGDSSNSTNTTNIFILYPSLFVYIITTILILTLWP